MIHDTQSAQTSQKEHGLNIYVIMKIMCPHSYHHNGFVATHALGTHGVRLHIAGTNEPKSAQQAKQGAQYK